MRRTTLAPPQEEGGTEASATDSSSKEQEELNEDDLLPVPSPTLQTEDGGTLFGDLTLGSQSDQPNPFTLDQALDLADGEEIILEAVPGSSAIELDEYERTLDEAALDTLELNNLAETDNECLELDAELDDLQASESELLTKDSSSDKADAPPKGEDFLIHQALQLGETNPSDPEQTDAPAPHLETSSGLPEASVNTAEVIEVVVEYEENSPTGSSEFDETTSEKSPQALPINAPLLDFQLPMGIWLGFHDQDPPIMARLAVHDPEEHNYTFVNRRGIKLRTLNETELAHLIDQELVEILQRSSDFRQQVSAMNKDKTT